MVNYIATHRANESVYLISSLLLPSALAIYFFMRQQALETTLLVLGVAVSLSILLIERTGSMLNSGSGLVVLAILIFIWFAGITWALKKLLPASRFSVIPLAFGAWLSVWSLHICWRFGRLFFCDVAVFILIAWRLLSKHRLLRQFWHIAWGMWSKQQYWYMRIFWVKIGGVLLYSGFSDFCLVDSKRIGSIGITVIWRWSSARHASWFNFGISYVSLCYFCLLRALYGILLTAKYGSIRRLHKYFIVDDCLFWQSLPCISAYKIGCDWACESALWSDLVIFLYCLRYGRYC